MPRRNDRRGVAEILFLALFLFSSAAPGIQGNEAIELNNEGVDLLKTGEIERAIDTLQAAMDRDPGSGTIAVNLATACVRRAEKLAARGKLEEAVHWLDRSLGYTTDDQDLRTAQAAAYNEIAAQYRTEKRYEKAISLLETAVSLKSDNLVLRNNLGLTLYRDNRREDALREFHAVVGIDPDNATARKMNGLILYWKGRMKEALVELEKAAKLDPGDIKVKETLEKIKKEYVVEKDFDIDDHVHFTVSFDGENDYRIGSAVIDYLEEAWLSVGNDLGFYPREKIAVVVYSNREFSELMNKPKNIGGLYDGKIRVPVGGLDRENDWDKLRRVLHHEYAHVVVHFLSHESCPLWLNEGIAEYESEEWEERKERRIIRALDRGTVIPLSTLSGALKGYHLPERTALAYCEAHSVVKFIADRYGVYNLRNILDLLDAGEGIDKALGKTVNLNVQQLEDSWLESFQAK